MQTKQQTWGGVGDGDFQPIPTRIRDLPPLIVEPEARIPSETDAQVVKMLAERGRVLITSEGQLPDDLQKYQFTMSAENMHDVMAFSQLLVGESATMASEAAVLGVPAFFISDTGRGYTDEEEAEFGMVFNFTTEQRDEIVSKLDELLLPGQLGDDFKEKHKRLLDKKIDTTEWLMTYVDGVVPRA